MTRDALFDEYAGTPREPRGAVDLHVHLRKSRWALVAAVVGSFVLGAPLSLVRLEGSRPWEPGDVIIMGAILAAATVPIAGVIHWMFARYARLYRSGRLVEGRVVEQRPGGVVLQVSVGDGPDRSFVPGLQAPMGSVAPVIVGVRGSALALVVAGRGDLRRTSLLTPEQIAAREGA